MIFYFSRSSRLLFLCRQKTNASDDRGRHRNGFEKDSAHREDHHIVDQAEGGGNDDTVSQDLRLSKGDEEGIGDQRDHQKQGDVALPGENAHHAHHDHQDRRHDVVGLGLFLDEIASQISQNAYHVQRKARGSAQEKIADAKNHDTGGLDRQKPLFGIGLIGGRNDQRGNDAKDLSPQFFIHVKFSLSKNDYSLY